MKNIHMIKLKNKIFKNNIELLLNKKDISE